MRRGESKIQNQASRIQNQASTITARINKRRREVERCVIQFYRTENLF